VEFKISFLAEFENVKKHSKDAKIYVIIMYTQKTENTGG